MFVEADEFPYVRKGYAYAPEPTERTLMLIFYAMSFPLGKLHHHIVALQVSEGTAVRKLEAATQKLSRQEALVLRLEQKIDEKDQALYHAKMEARNKAKFLKKTIQDLRRQYSGALPLMKQVKDYYRSRVGKVVEGTSI